MFILWLLGVCLIFLFSLVNGQIGWFLLGTAIGLAYGIFRTISRRRLRSPQP